MAKTKSEANKPKKVNINRATLETLSIIINNYYYDTDLSSESKYFTPTNIYNMQLCDDDDPYADTTISREFYTLVYKELLVKNGDKDSNYTLSDLALANLDKLKEFAKAPDRNQALDFKAFIEKLTCDSTSNVIVSPHSESDSLSPLGSIPKQSQTKKPHKQKNIPQEAEDGILHFPKKSKQQHNQNTVTTPSTDRSPLNPRMAQITMPTAIVPVNTSTPKATTESLENAVSKIRNLPSLYLKNNNGTQGPYRKPSNQNPVVAQNTTTAQTVPINTLTSTTTTSNVIGSPHTIVDSLSMLSNIINQSPNTDTPKLRAKRQGPFLGSTDAKKTKVNEDTTVITSFNDSPSQNIQTGLIQETSPIEQTQTNDSSLQSIQVDAIQETSVAEQIQKNDSSSQSIHVEPIQKSFAAEQTQKNDSSYQNIQASLAQETSATEQIQEADDLDGLSLEQLKQLVEQETNDVANLTGKLMLIKQDNEKTEKFVLRNRLGLLKKSKQETSKQLSEEQKRNADLKQLANSMSNFMASTVQTKTTVNATSNSSSPTTITGITSPITTNTQTQPMLLNKM